jgi:hypothetical protein
MLNKSGVGRRCHSPARMQGKRVCATPPRLRPLGLLTGPTARSTVRRCDGSEGIRKGGSWPMGGLQGYAPLSAEAGVACRPATPYEVSRRLSAEAGVACRPATPYEVSRRMGSSVVQQRNREAFWVLDSVCRMDSGASVTDGATDGTKISNTRGGRTKT